MIDIEELIEIILNEDPDTYVIIQLNDSEVAFTMLFPVKVED